MTSSSLRRIVLAAGLVAALAPGARAATQSVAIPAYFYPVYPDPLWSRMNAASPTVSFAVMNPANGAGAAPDANYTAQVAATRAAGVKVLGYVYSSYATRDPSLLEADIDNYYAWYGVDGIFIDEADNTCPNAAYYADLSTYAKAKGGLGLTVINPGTNTPECFVTTADVILEFEGSYAQYQSWVPSGWESGYDPGHFWHLVYATAEADMPSTVLLSQARGAGYVYVTPDSLPNPWDSLPGEPYWSHELAYVQPTAGGCPASVTKPKLQVRGIDTMAADDSLKFSGSFTLAGTPAIDPVADGLRFVVGDGGGSEVDVTLPEGAYAGNSGWIAAASGTKWTWRDDGAAPAFGIAKATLKVKSDGASTTATFKVSGVDGSYALSASELPLTGALLLDPSSALSLCGNATFPGPKPACAVTGGGSGIRCR